jgi:hypothetical protein
MQRPVVVFSAARFADQAEGFAFVDVKADVVHGCDPRAGAEKSAAAREVLHEV